MIEEWQRTEEWRKVQRMLYIPGEPGQVQWLVVGPKPAQHVYAHCFSEADADLIINQHERLIAVQRALT